MGESKARKFEFKGPGILDAENKMGNHWQYSFNKAQKPPFSNDVICHRRTWDFDHCEATLQIFIPVQKHALLVQNCFTLDAICTLENVTILVGS